MAVLTTKARAKLPKATFGEPGKRAYPMPDPGHAANAKARATQAVKAGRMSTAEEGKIDAKANRVLKVPEPSLKHPPSKVTAVKTDRGEFGFRRQK
jgi:hypothetical protein